MIHEELTTLRVVGTWVFEEPLVGMGAVRSRVGIQGKGGCRGEVVRYRAGLEIIDTGHLAEPLCYEPCLGAHNIPADRRLLKHPRSDHNPASGIRKSGETLRT